LSGGFILLLGACLITDSVEERAPAQGEEKHGVSLAVVREEGDEDDLLPDILKRMGIGLVSGCWWALAWASAGLLGWAAAWAASAGKPGKLLLILFSVLYFLFLFYFLVLNSVLNSYLNYFLFCRFCSFHSYKN
jgi:hypothetical protein